MKSHAHTSRSAICLAGAIIWSAASLIQAADYSSTVLADSPVGYWRLDETGLTAAPDPVATNLGSLGPIGNGTYLNSPLMQQPGAIVSDPDFSTTFSVADQNKIDVPYQADLNPSVFTIECWAKVTGGSSYRSPLTSRTSSPTAGYILYCSPDPANNWEFWTGNGSSWNNVSGGPATIGAWTHLVGVYDGATFSFYVNGELKNTLAASLNVNALAPLRIGAGASEGAGQFWFEGGVDEVAVYNTALDAFKVLAHYDAGTNGLGNYEATIRDDNPVGYWRLNEASIPPVAEVHAANLGSLGASADGTYLGGVTLEQPGALTGDANTAAGFDGSNDKIEVPNQSSLNATQFTVEAWAKVLGGAGNYRSPVSSRGDNPQRGFIIYAASNNKWELWTGTGQQSVWSIISGPDVVMDEWAHLVGTFDGVTKSFYVNGALVGQTNVAYDVNPTNVFRIGAGQNEIVAGNYFFNGDIDDVSMYDYALTPEQVLAHYVAGTGSPPPCVPPIIVSAPAGTTDYEGATLHFEVVATGSLPLRYEWRDFGFPFEGETNRTFTMTNVQPSQSSTLSVYVENDCGFEESLFDVEILPTSPPVITTEPISQTIYRGGRAAFEVVATGGLRLTYQWKFMGTNLQDETNRTLVIYDAQDGNVGDYQVTVGNAAGTVDSGVATLTIIDPEPGSYAEAVVSDQPAAYWRLNESSGTVIQDFYGSYNGNISNSVTLGLTGALVGDPDTAAGFDGVSRVEVPYAAALNWSNFTVECWARVDGSAGSYRSPVSSRGDFPQRGFIFYAANSDQWQFWTGTGAQIGWHIIPGPDVVIGEWVHLAGTYDGVTKSFYVNGVLFGQADVAYGVNPTNAFRIGAGQNETPTGNFFFNGVVDEVAMYDRALSSGRILAHYALGVGSGTVSIEQSGADLIIHWSKGVLEGADEVTGPFSDVSSTPPSYTVPTGAAMRFYRVRVSD